MVLADPLAPDSRPRRLLHPVAVWCSSASWCHIRESSRVTV